MSNLSYSIIEHPHRWAFAIAVLVCAPILAWRGWLLMDGMRAAAWGVAELPQKVSDLQATVERVPGNVELPLVLLADKHATEIREAAQKEIRHGVDEGLRRVDATMETLDDRTTQALTMAGAGIMATLSTVDGIRKDLHPILAHAGSVAAQIDDAAPLFLDCDHNPDCAFNRFQGTSKAIERAAMNVGQMSQDVQHALPAALVTWQRIGNNSDQTTAATAEVMQNFARATKPLPPWFRIPLSITGAVAPTVAAGVSTAVALGAFR